MDVHPSDVEIAQLAQRLVAEHLFRQVAELQEECLVLKPRSDGFCHQFKGALNVDAVIVIFTFTHYAYVRIYIRWQP